MEAEIIPTQDRLEVLCKLEIASVPVHILEESQLLWKGILMLICDPLLGGNWGFDEEVNVTPRTINCLYL